MGIYLNTENGIEVIDKNSLGTYKRGLEGKVYNYNGNALKIYHPISGKIRMGEKTANLLTSLETKRLLIPNKLLYKKRKLFFKDKFVGYMTTPYIDNSIPFFQITHMSSDKLSSEIMLIYDDLKILSKNKILIKDYDHPDNIIYNGDIYFVDCGSFSISNSKNIEYHNFTQINNALYFQLITLQQSYKYNKNNIKEIFENNFEELTEEEIYILYKILIRIYYKNFKEILSSNNEQFKYRLLEIIAKFESINNYKLELIKSTLNKNNNLINDYEKSLIKKIYK